MVIVLTADVEFQAWDDTFLNWENSTRYLDQYPKTKLEEGQMSETIHRSVTKRRTSNQSTEHELEVIWPLLYVSLFCCGMTRVVFWLWTQSSMLVRQ